MWIPGEPRGKGRPRAVRRGKHVGVYTDAKTASYENLVALATRQKLPPELTQVPLFNGPVSVAVSAYLAKSNNRRKAETIPTRKPDVNNIVAAVLDGITQVGSVWTDDRHVAELHARKLWAGPDQEPGVRVRIRSLA